MRLTDPVASRVKRLRDKIADTRFILPAFDVALTDKGATKGLVEYDGTNFNLTATGGKAKDAQFNVESKSYATVSQLQVAIASTLGWDSILDPNAQVDHPSSDLLISTPVDVTKTRVKFNTRRFSDSELVDILRMGVARHNQEMTLETIPDAEFALVLVICHAESLYRLAADASKRSGLDQDVKTLIEVARSMEKQYTDDLTRLNLYSRRDDVVNQPDTEKVLHGDINVGQSYRVSPRTGWRNIAFNTPPPALQELTHRIVRRGGAGLDFVEFTWRRPHNAHFGMIAIYRSTFPDFTALQKSFTGGIFIDPPGIPQIYANFDQRITYARDYAINGQYSQPGFQYGTQYFYRVFLMDTSWAFWRSEAIPVIVPPPDPNQQPFPPDYTIGEDQI